MGQMPSMAWNIMSIGSSHCNYIISKNRIACVIFVLQRCFYPEKVLPKAYFGPIFYGLYHIINLLAWSDPVSIYKSPGLLHLVPWLVGARNMLLTTVFLYVQ